MSKLAMFITEKFTRTGKRMVLINQEYWDENKMWLKKRFPNIAFSPCQYSYIRIIKGSKNYKGPERYRDHPDYKFDIDRDYGKVVQQLSIMSKCMLRDDMLENEVFVDDLHDKLCMASDYICYLYNMFKHKEVTITLSYEDARYLKSILIYSSNEVYGGKSEVCNRLLSKVLDVMGNKER